MEDLKKIQELKRKITETTNLYNQVVQKYREKENELKKLSTEIETIKKELTVIMQKKEQANTLKKSIELEITKLQNTLNQLERTHQENSLLFETYKNQEIQKNALLKEKESKRNNLRTELDGLNLRIRELSRKIEEFKRGVI